jgi:polysaccharide deacetylase family protein (PEP-CTERM system associated)
MQDAVRNALTVDVEDYFQVSAFEGHISRADWDRIPRRVEANTDRLLALFEEHGAKATFFVLGWVAERHPALIRRLAEAGHEVASHGYAHVRATGQTPAEFRADVAGTKALLEDTAGRPVLGFRAASFSIGARNLWALDVLAEVGYRYSSSIYPVRHDLYGMPEAPRFPFRHNGTGILEVPITTVQVFGRNLPSGGGGYFRLLPYCVSEWALRRVNEREGQPGVFYCHPWEIDPDQPRQAGIGLKTRFRHYTNLGRMEARMRRLLTDFAWGRMDQVFLSEPQRRGEVEK